MPVGRRYKRCLIHFYCSPYARNGSQWPHFSANLLRSSSHLLFPMRRQRQPVAAHVGGGPAALQLTSSAFHAQATAASGRISARICCAPAHIYCSPCAGNGSQWPRMWAADPLRSSSRPLRPMRRQRQPVAAHGRGPTALQRHLPRQHGRERGGRGRVGRRASAGVRRAGRLHPCQPGGHRHHRRAGGAGRLNNLC